MHPDLPCSPQTLFIFMLSCSIVFGWGLCGGERSVGGLYSTFCMHVHVHLCVFCGFAVITGPQKSAVASAVTRIEVLLESFRRKQPFTHFLSFALNQPQVQEGFQHFKAEVLEHCSQVGQQILLLETVKSSGIKNYSHFTEVCGWFHMDG